MSTFLDSNGLLYLWGKIKALVGGKVDKVEGKALSSNDYTSSEKDKLAHIAANANNYSHPSGDGNKHVPAVGTTSNGKFLRAGASAGNMSWEMLTKADISDLGDTAYSDATQSASGLMSSSDKKKLDGFSSASAYALKSDITSMYVYKGSKASFAALPSSGNNTGDVWNTEATGMNYAWNGSTWDALGEVLSISTISNSEIDTIVAS